MSVTITSQIVLAALRVNPQRAVGRAELMALTGCSSREVRMAISELRRGSWLIVGDGAGYRFARNAEEVKRMISDLERQERTLQEVRQALTEAVRLRFGPWPCAE